MIILCYRSIYIYTKFICPWGTYCMWLTPSSSDIYLILHFIKKAPILRVWKFSVAYRLMQRTENVMAKNLNDVSELTLTAVPSARYYSNTAAVMTLTYLNNKQVNFSICSWQVTCILCCIVYMFIMLCGYCFIYHCEVFLNPCTCSLWQCCKSQILYCCTYCESKQHR